MDFNLQDTLAVLERTPAALDGMLRGLPDAWTRSNEGDGTFSPYDVIGHLNHGERTDWIPRARILLEHGESRPFDRYDRFAQQRESAGKTLDELLDEFATLRRGNLDLVRSWNLDAAAFARRGTHPVLGTVTLGNLFATWTAHDLTHVHQISRCMAGQYRVAVGPWTKFLGVLHCQGHGE
jgi:hypothetical protein